MATFLDFSLLSGARAIFAFLLIFVLVYALLRFTNLFNMSDSLASLAALCISILASLSPQTVRVIEVVTPWYVLLMFVLVFILLISMIFGGLGDNLADIKSNMGSKYKQVMVWILVISLIIFFSGLGYVFLSGSESGYSLNADGVPSNVSTNSHSASSSSTSSASGAGEIGGKGVGTFLETLFHPKVIGMVIFLVLACLTVLLLSYKSS